MRISLCLTVVLLIVLSPSYLGAQTSPADQVQVGLPPTRRADPPAESTSVEELEKRGDQLRSDKAFLDAMDYYRVALKKKPDSATLYNKLGIAELQIQRFKEARKDFEHAIKLDHEYSDAINNLGVTYYSEKKQRKAIKQYEKAIKLRPDSASYYSNLGAAYFAKKDWDKAVPAYAEAIRLDPEIFERTSHAGVSAQTSSPDDRAYFQYVLAKLYAKSGDADRALQCLRRSMEEGYKSIHDVYKDGEFTELRKDPRFTQLMTDPPLAIPGDQNN